MIVNPLDRGARIVDGQTPFSKENRVRLIYLLDDLLEKPRPYSLGGYIGGEEFSILDELIRKRLGRLELVEYSEHSYQAISAFIQIAPENELLDLIELVPSAKIRASRATMGQYELKWLTNSEVTKIMEALDAFLGAVGSRARFRRDTGILNRDGFEIEQAGPLGALSKIDELEADLKGLMSSSELFSCVLLDLDNFKTVNDRNGHRAGDTCLEAVAQSIGKAIARKGRLYRFRQGDEFAVLLRNFTASEAHAVAERIRKEIEDAKPGGDVRVTASIGIVSSEELGLGTPAELLGAADEAMYVSKVQGKNRVTTCPVATEELEAARAARAESKGRG
jgi:diguanylate cyclase (GGDEF)-like protein